MHSVSERDYLKTLGIDGRIILTVALKKWSEETWTGLNWLSIGIGDGLL
jgi:hypothetical protein